MPRVFVRVMLQIPLTAFESFVTMADTLKRTTRTPKTLGVSDLYRPAHLDSLSFETTAELKSLRGVIEQSRAVRALELGLNIDSRNYNVFVAGASGTGKTTVVRTLLNKLAPKQNPPPDWVYVHNFKDPAEPISLKLPAGTASGLKQNMELLVDRLWELIPALFHSKEHQEKVQGILNAGMDKENERFVALSKRAKKIGFTIKSTKTGIVTIPMLNGELISNKDYATLNEKQRKKVEKNRKRLDPHISEFLQETRMVEIETQESITAAQRELGESVAGQLFAELVELYNTQERVLAHLEQVYKDIIHNISKFLPEDVESERNAQGGFPTIKEYQVNVVVDNSDVNGAPVVFETHPTFSNLFGKLERRLENGVYFTDFTLIRAGSLLKASGGFLVVNVLDLFNQPGVWEHLKSCLRNKEVTIEDPGFLSPFLPAAGIKPEPIPTRPKLILHGSSWAYYYLYRSDEDFRKIFQVLADFDDEIDRTRRTVREYAQFIATTCENNDLLPVHKKAVGTIVEEGARLADSKTRLTLKFNDIANLVVEANYLATRKSGTKMITDKHVKQALIEREYRCALVSDKLQREIMQGRQLIDTSGAKVGQLNGLAVYAIGEHRFAKPTRITANTFAGKGAIINIEREAKLSGKIHDKGVYIIQGYLGATHAQDTPLALNVTICFEQSYGGVDGDSASSTELYAILSSLSGIPLKQGIGVTGSVNQKGDIQPIGGVNEKIEGFFRVCSARKLTGEQGCIIPHQNVRNLMLRKHVRDAVEAGQFHIWPIKHIHEGIEILTGVRAGNRRKNGTFAPGTVHYEVAKKLAHFANAGSKKKSNDKK